MVRTSRRGGLNNPTHDADLMATRLQALGFAVEEVKDADRSAMQAAFTRFGGRLRAAGRDAITVFYYSGHGAQQDGVNYLVPTDATARTADQLRFQAPPMQFLLDDMAAVGNEVNIIILDACRDMALTEGYRAYGQGGLAEIRQPHVFIAYATSPGRTAADGVGLNSPFTTALANALQREPELPVALMFGDVQDAVNRATGGAQSPEYRNGLVGQARWSFSSTPGVATTGTKAVSSAGDVGGIGRSVESAPTGNQAASGHLAIGAPTTTAPQLSTQTSHPPFDETLLPSELQGLVLQAREVRTEAEAAAAEARGRAVASGD